jgi:hypothetical protein
MAESSSETHNNNTNIQSPVLQQVYPDMLRYVQQYGHPNIPLGSTAGRQCDTLRRLHTQGKLHPDDVQLLDSAVFRWHSLEDVYWTADFDELYTRLATYQRETADVSPPKKYAPDPELGAWVTGLRRVGQAQVQPQHAAKLNSLHFQWTSPRQCGSVFMQQYRALLARLENSRQQEDATAAVDEVWADAHVRQWVTAQRQAAARGALSETRLQYMADLVGADWLVGIDGSSQTLVE